MLLASLLVPSTLAVKVGLTLTMLRFVLLVLLLPSLFRLYGKVRRGRYVPVVSDMFVVALAIWMEVALLVTAGPAGLTSFLGVRPVEFLAAYLIGRCFFGDRIGLEQFVQVLLVILVVMLLMGLIDSAAGKNLFGQVARGNYADPNAHDLQSQYRFGLVRARGPLEHSIIYGLFFSVCATLTFYLATSLRAKLFGLAVCVAGVAIALSSAPLLSFLVFAALALYDRLLAGSRWRWHALLGLAGYGLAMVLILYEDPIGQLIQIFTLDPKTGSYRLLIWQWVAYNLQTSPLFGIGLSEWTRLSSMSPSIDAVWLNQALQAGYGGVFLLAAAIAGAFFVVSTRFTRRVDDAWTATGEKAVTIALLQMIFVSMTVHYWGSSWALFALLVGIRAGLSEARYLPATAGSARPPLPRSSLAGRAVPSVTRPAGIGTLRRRGPSVAIHPPQGSERHA